MAIQESKQEQDRVAASDAGNERGEVPDTARTYERAKPDKENGMGQMTANQFTPDPDHDDEVGEAVTNQKESRELTADDYLDQRDTPDLSEPGAERGAAPQQSGDAPRGTAASAAETKGTVDSSNTGGSAAAREQQSGHQQAARGELHQQGRQQNKAQRPETADVTHDQPTDDESIAPVQPPPVAVTPDDIRQQNQRRAGRDQSQGAGPQSQQSQQNKARQGRDSRPEPETRTIVDPPSGRDPSKPIGPPGEGAEGEGAEGHDPSKPISPPPDHSMKDEQPLGWDQAPTEPDEMPAGNTRHPRQGGKGGVPDVGEEDVEG